MTIIVNIMLSVIKHLDDVTEPFIFFFLTSMSFYFLLALHEILDFMFAVYIVGKIAIKPILIR
jgi:hypothetical protein